MSRITEGKGTKCPSMVGRAPNWNPYIWIPYIWKAQPKACVSKKNQNMLETQHVFNM
jgi:hypothetical protein